MRVTRRGFLEALGIGIVGAKAGLGRTIEELYTSYTHPPSTRRLVGRGWDAEAMREMLRTPYPWRRYPHA